MQREEPLDEHGRLEQGLRAAFGDLDDAPADPARPASRGARRARSAPPLPASAVTVVGTLQRWLRDPGLAPVRDAEDLPEDWSALWAAADALLRQHPPAAREP